MLTHNYFFINQVTRERIVNKKQILVIHHHVRTAVLVWALRIALYTSARVSRDGLDPGANVPMYLVLVQHSLVSTAFALNNPKQN